MTLTNEERKRARALATQLLTAANTGEVPDEARRVINAMNTAMGSRTQSTNSDGEPLLMPIRPYWQKDKK